jgi:hypothetical protein
VISVLAVCKDFVISGSHDSLLKVMIWGRGGGEWGIVGPNCKYNPEPDYTDSGLL